jgi:hypothetical protein
VDEAIDRDIASKESRLHDKKLSDKDRERIRSDLWDLDRRHHHLRDDLYYHERQFDDLRHEAQFYRRRCQLFADYSLTETFRKQLPLP